MSEQKDKDCPILLALDRHPLKCIKEDCAWWDSKNKRCAVLTIAYRLGWLLDLQEQIAKVSSK